MQSLCGSHRRHRVAKPVAGLRNGHCFRSAMCDFLVPKGVPMKRLVTGAAVVWIGATWLCASESRIASPPNVVFVLADDLGYTDLACYGSSYDETPHIDRLASDLGERHKVATREASVAAELQEELRAWWSRLQAPRPTANPLH
jgi:hypothetical protein